MVKKVWQYDYSFWQNPRTWQTKDTRTDTAWRQKPRLCIALCGKNHSSWHLLENAAKLWHNAGYGWQIQWQQRQWQWQRPHWQQSTHNIIISVRYYTSFVSAQCSGVPPYFLSCRWTWSRDHLHNVEMHLCNTQGSFIACRSFLHTAVWRTG